MDSNIVPLLTTLFSLIAVAISFGTFIYNYLQNRRRIDVNLFIEDDEDDMPIVHLRAFNSGYRSVALIKAKFLVNDVDIVFKEGFNKLDRTKFPNAPSSINYWLTEKLVLTLLCVDVFVVWKC